MSKDIKLFILLAISFLVMLTASFLILQHTSIKNLIHTGEDKTNTGKLVIKAPETVAINEPFTVQVEIETNNTDVNAAGIYLRFEPAHLQLLSMDTASSFCQFYPEKRYDQSLGTITLACGSPHPGVNGRSLMMKLEFMPVRLGNTVIATESKSQLLKSDGRGDTNILQSFPRAEISVQNTL